MLASRTNPCIYQQTHATHTLMFTYVGVQTEHVYEYIFSSMDKVCISDIILYR